MNFSLEHLIRGLVSRGTSNYLTRPVEATTVPTSIRLKPTTRAFLECQAESLNTSLQSVITMILDGVEEATTHKVGRTLGSIRDRFFYLFSAHGISLPQTAEILKEFGYTLSTLESPSRLLDLLNPETIRFLSRTFFVEPTWISGSGDRVVNVTNFSWYKNTHAAIKRLLEYQANGLSPHVIFIRRSNSNFKAAREDDDRGLADKEPIGVSIRLTYKTADGGYYYLYDTWAFERWNYHNCRSEIKLFIAACTDICAITSYSRVSFSGHSLSEAEIESIVMGKSLPCVALNQLGPATWYPDDYADMHGEVTEEAKDWEWIKNVYETRKYNEFIRDVLATHTDTSNKQAVAATEP